MRINSFKISNFKGIREATIDLHESPPGNIITLIGLNESGKTTVLEALSHFIAVDESTSSIVKTVAAEQRPIDLIPKSQKSNFTGIMSVEANVALDDDDVDALARHLWIHKEVRLIPQSCPREFVVRREYKFHDSDLKESTSRYFFHPQYTKKGQTKVHVARSNDNTSSIWTATTAFLRSRFPKIVYFPTFLFSVPERIYLENPPEWLSDEEEIINTYFAQVLQDVADSLNQDISIQKHIVDRVSRKRSMFETVHEFFSAFVGMDETSQIRAVVNKLSGAITKTVFSAWNEIFEHGVADKSVRVEWGIDTERGGVPYVQLQIYDGEQYYAVHERSLGFRWFFTFLLFTQFRKSRRTERGTIFLFDEPASNLHARAQSKLLESFGKTATGSQFIIYSTHSHYMIEPMWLEKAFIVENKGLNYEDEEAASRFQSADTDVQLTRYRQFVHRYPRRVSYFQPALDALRFHFGPLVPGELAVIVEGKYDFHPLRYFQRRLGIARDLVIFPAPSASEAGTLISLMRGLGTKFVVLLDDDKDGRKASERYRNQHLLGDNQIFTLSSLDAKMEGKAFESLYSKEVEGLATTGTGAPTKGEYSLLFQRLLMEENFRVGLGTTTNRIKAVLAKLEARLRGLPEPPSKPRKKAGNSRNKKAPKIAKH